MPFPTSLVSRLPAKFGPVPRSAVTAITQELRQPGKIFQTIVVPIPGTSKIDHLNENLGAIDVELTQADLREIETALTQITVRGGRMNEAQMKVVDQTT